MALTRSPSGSPLWLARIISYALDLPPTALVKETNRATAETTQTASQSEGQKAFENYLKEIMDIIIHDYYGYEGIEFIFATKESVEPLKQAQIDQIYINMRVLSPSEIRSRLGYDPLTEEQRQEFQSLQSAANPLQAILGNKIEKADKPRAPDKLSAGRMAKAQADFKGILERFFRRVKPGIIRQVQDKYQKAISTVQKIDARTRQKIIDMTLDDLNYDDWSLLFGDASDCLEDIARAGA